MDLLYSKKEGNYLVKYRIDSVGEEYAIYMKISEVCRFTPSNVMELFNTEFNDAYKLFYDNDSQYCASCKRWAHNVDEKLIENELSRRRVFYVSEEHFLKKSDYPDDLSSSNESK